MILRAKITVFMSMVCLFVLPVPVTLEWFEYGPEAFWLHFTNALLLASAAGSLLLLKYTSKINHVATLFISAAVVSVFVTSVNGRGLIDPSLNWIIIAPFAGSIIGGTLAAIVLTSISLTGVFLIASLSGGLFPWLPPETWEPFSWLTVSQILVPILFSGLMAAVQRIIFGQTFQTLSDTESELWEERQKLFHSQKLTSLGEMAGGIAHEINNPLTVIQGKAQLLTRKLYHEDLEKEEIAKGLEKIIQTTDRIGKVVNTMRRLARMDSNSEDQKAIDVSKEIQDALEISSAKFYHLEVAFKYKPLEEDSLFILGHEGDLSQVLISLLNNSVDAIKDLKERWISLEVTASEEHVDIYVIDAGKGIPIEVAEKIFQPFFTTKPIGQGTGMGMGISKSIVEGMDGTLQYDPSKENTTFKIRLKRVHNHRKISLRSA